MHILRLEINEDIYPVVYGFLKLIAPNKIKINELSIDDKLLTNEDIEEYNKAMDEIKTNKTVKLADYIKKRKINV